MVERRLCVGQGRPARRPVAHFLPDTKTARCQPASGFLGGRFTEPPLLFITICLRQIVSFV